MAFSVGDRVRVSDNFIHNRGQYGVVLSVSGNDHHVRIDGYPSGATLLLTTSQLVSTTLPEPLTYAEDA